MYVEGMTVNVSRLDRILTDSVGIMVADGTGTGRKDLQ